MRRRSARRVARYRRSPAARTTRAPSAATARCGAGASTITASLGNDAIDQPGRRRCRSRTSLARPRCSPATTSRARSSPAVRVQRWGDNGNGQLGNNSLSSDAHTPVAVAGVTGATALALGDQHACALVAGGAVQCWGANDDGQIGDGTTQARPAPTMVPGVTAQAIDAGGDSTCAVDMGGNFQCWATTSTASSTAPPTADRRRRRSAACRRSPRSRCTTISRA